MPTNTVVACMLLIRTTLRCAHLHIIDEEGGGRKERVGGPGVERQGYRLARVVGESTGHVKVHLLPVAGRIGVAGLLQLRNHFAATIQHVHSEGISTGTTCARGGAIPPVTDCNIRRTIGYGQVLGDAIITAAVAAEIGAVVSSMRIRRIDDFIATRRGLLPWVSATLEAAIVDQMPSQEAEWAYRWDYRWSWHRCVGRRRS